MNTKSSPETSAEVFKNLESRGESRMEFGLERVRNFLDSLGGPHRNLRAVHVAGTNGKGSVCKMLHSVLSAAGYNAGVYTSPHLNSPLERMETSSGRITEEEFDSLYRELLSKPGQEFLTYFEAVTAIAFLFFKRRKADIVILETGLGGRLDATNVCERPDLTLISSIGFDHMNWLGKDLKSIAMEKGGIFKKGVPALAGLMAQEARTELESQAVRAGTARMCFLEKEAGPVRCDWERGIQQVEYKGGRFALPMLGAHQRHNAALVLEAVEILRGGGWRIPEESVRQGLWEAKISGRWDLRQIQGVPWVFDVAHNLQAVEAFLNTLQESPWARHKPKAAIVSFFKDKDFVSMASRLAPYFDRFVIPPLDSARAADPKEIQAVFEKHGARAEIAVNSAQAWEMIQGEPPAFGSVLGSFRLTAPLLNFL